MARVGIRRLVTFAVSLTVLGLVLACGSDAAPEASNPRGSGAAGSGESGASAGGEGSGTAGAGGESAGGSGGVQQLFIERIIRREGCLPRRLITGQPGTSTEGRILCTIIHATRLGCDCDRPGFAPGPERFMENVRKELLEIGRCNDEAVPCSDYCACEIEQFEGTSSDTSSDLYTCQNEVTIEDPNFAGFCYVDPEGFDATGDPYPLGNPELVEHCPAISQRTLRFVGLEAPDPTDATFLVCEG